MISGTKKQLTHQQIETLVQYHFGAETKLLEMKELTDGWFNNAYYVKVLYSPESGKQDLKNPEEMVLKVSPPPEATVLTYEEKMMEVEVAVMQCLVEKTTVPIPKILAVRYDDSELQRKYYFMEYIHGDAWNRVKKQLTQEQRDGIMQQMAEYQNQFNQLTHDTFGSIIPHADGTIKESLWSEALAQMFERLYKDAAHLRIRIPRSLRLIPQKIRAHRDMFDEVDTPRLIHWDLWEGNVFINFLSENVDGGIPTIIGITDFERALWGDPLMEFLFWQFDRVRPMTKVYNYPEKFIDLPLNQQIRRLVYNLYFFVIWVLESYYRKYKKLFSLSIRMVAYTMGFQTTRRLKKMGFGFD